MTYRSNLYVHLRKIEIGQKLRETITKLKHQHLNSNQSSLQTGDNRLFTKKYGDKRMKNGHENQLTWS